MARDISVKKSLGALAEQIPAARVLLVGAGGIGCELLKNLVRTGFGHVCIVDLDTIDLSNLNRQFLFRHEHIKKSKALVAKEAAARFNPNVQLEAHHANIKDVQFSVSWFREFNVVFNALDNLEARRHVNRMCLAADVPLIESGTTGFNGQVQVIKKGTTECYDCNPKQTPKSFPVCTIRSTPSQPIHCIVWAKSYLFTEIFGTSEDDSPDLDESKDSENALELENLRKEAQALQQIRSSAGQPDFARQIFEKVYDQDIQRLCSMEDMWKTRQAPDPLRWEEQKASEQHTQTEYRDQDIWTRDENFAVFCSSVESLGERLRATSDVLTFDKDDDDMLNFVTASANLRSIIFGIERRSKFEIKQMAGNIIPAIATTNAMTAALCVFQAFKVLRGEYDQARMVFLERSGARVINSDKLNGPNPACAVCGTAHAVLEVDLERALLQDLVHTILFTMLGYDENMSVNSDSGVIFDPDLEDNLPQKLSDLGVTGGSFLTVVDDREEVPRVNLSLNIVSISMSEGDSCRLLEKPDIPPKALEMKDAKTIANGTNGHPPDTNSNKRKRSAEPDVVSNIKKAKAPIGQDDLIIVNDGPNSSILID